MACAHIEGCRLDAKQHGHTLIAGPEIAVYRHIKQQIPIVNGIFTKLRAAFSANIGPFRTLSFVFSPSDKSPGYSSAAPRQGISV